MSDRETLPSVRNLCQGSWRILEDSVPELLLTLLLGVRRRSASPAQRLTANQAGTSGRRGERTGQAEKRLGRPGTSTQPAHSRCTNMKDHTTNPVVCKILNHLLARRLNALGRKVFLADDRRARDRGWQITSRHGGLSRSYRDPRFDFLAPCPTCNGRGANACGVTCSDCNGTGRVVLGSAATSGQ